MPCLQSCCRCWSLKAGTIFSGIAGIILSIISIVLLFTARVEFKTILLDWLPEWIVKIILVVNLAMTILICIFLIIGAIKKNIFFMLPWVVLGIILAIGLLFSVIYTSVVFFIDKQTTSGIYMLVFGIIFFCIYLYMWFVVFSYFQEIQAELSRGRYAKAPYRR